MPTSLQTSGTEVTALIEHRKGDGTLIYKSVTMPEPVLPEEPILPTSLNLNAIREYVGLRARWQGECNELISTYNIIQKYHELRAHYAEAKQNRDKDIPIKYRTGEPYPKTKEDAKKEIKILKKIIKEG